MGQRDAAAPQHPSASPGREGAPFQGLPCRQTAREGRAAQLWGYILAPPPFPLPPLGLGGRDALPGAGTSDPGSITPPPAASPPAPSCHSTGRGTKERRPEKKRCRASPSWCRSPPASPFPSRPRKSQHLPAPLQPGDGNVEAIALGKAATVSQKQLFGLSATQALQHSCFPSPALTPSSPGPSSQWDPQPPAPPRREGGCQGNASSHRPAALLLETGRQAIPWHENLQREGAPAMHRTCRGAGRCTGLARGKGTSRGHQGAGAGCPVLLEHPTCSSQEMQRGPCPCYRDHPRCPLAG